MEFNRYRLKTASELMREAELALDILRDRGLEAMSRAGRTKESPDPEDIIDSVGEVAEMIGMKRSSFSNLKKVHELAKTHPAVADKLAKVDKGELTINAAWKSVRSIDKERPHKDEVPEFIKYFNQWTFTENDIRFGLAYPGRICGQAIGNLIYYYTEPGDLVVDPMAGGGPTGDVAEFLGRECRMFDLHPSRPDIEQWNVKDGFPLTDEAPQLIFMDPPYWNMIDEKYGEGSASRLSLADFYVWYWQLLRDASYAVKLGGFVAVVNMQSYFKLPDEFKDGYIDWPIETFNCLRKQEGMRPWSRFTMTLPRTIYTGADVDNAIKGRFFLPIVADFIVFRRMA